MISFDLNYLESKIVLDVFKGQIHVGDLRRRDCYNSEILVHGLGHKRFKRLSIHISFIDVIHIDGGGLLLVMLPHG